MDLAFSEKDEAFRAEVRGFIEEAFDQEMREASAKTVAGYLPKEMQIRWQKRLHVQGWLAPNWPVEHGGPGWDVTQKFIFDDEMARAGAPMVIPFGPRMVAPVIMKFGTEEQKKQHLPDILATNMLWCQGYSEPGAGSDLAAVQCRADDHGDHYLVNGSKIWTSVAQYADWIFCLVRTSKEEKRQNGITFLLMEMNTPGITVEPIITIDLPKVGYQEVNQVFFEDVKVPKSNRIGEAGKGWTYAKYLLEFERGSAYAGRLRQTMLKIRKIANAESQDGAKLIDDAAFSGKLASADAQLTALEMTEFRILSRLASGQNMGAESSLMKCRGTEIQQLASELMMEAVGNYALPFQQVDFGRNEPPIGPDYASTAAPKYFNYRKASIYAGSNEIQRNIMAKLILGL